WLEPRKLSLARVDESIILGGGSIMNDVTPKPCQDSACVIDDPILVENADAIAWDDTADVVVAGFGGAVL
ncbi:MAG: hypothetical protein WAO76_08860, partial [Georgfuchsia sp.]